MSQIPGAAPPSPAAATPPQGSRHIKRNTSLLARGEPMVWLTGMALTAAVCMILALLGIVAWGGFSTFWPRPVHSVELLAGDSFLGVPIREESYTRAVAEPASAARGEEASVEPPAPSEASAHTEIPALPAGVTPESLRRLYRVGNKEFLGQPFRWVDVDKISSIQRPEWALFVEREGWGVWIGIPQAVLIVDVATIAAPSPEAIPLTGTAPTEWGERAVQRTVIGPAPDGAGFLVREQTTLAEGPAESWERFQEMHPAATERREQMEHLKEVEIGEVNRRLEAERLRLRLAELRRAEGEVSDDDVARARERFESRRAELDAEYAVIRERIGRIETADARSRVVVMDPATGRFAPVAQSTPDEPMRLSQVVRAVPANRLGLADKWGVYFSRWWEFLADDPRESNTEGGVFPVIFGTVVMTLLLSVAVVPLGVIAALYLREYAKQGWIVSAVRIAVNNLAGVPSIVYGVFGLGFFCYTVGRYIDAGPAEPWDARPWLLALLGLSGLIAVATVAQLGSRSRPGQSPLPRHRLFAAGAMLMWIGAVALIIFLVATTPYFKGFFRAKLPTATFGTKGILWSALTLALLTLPVVIVATEEAISAVPRSLREGSYGCGASKWQTIYRIVLPRAAPGIMTGMILAMARGAGEVAPLMLVGAVKLAPELPFEADFPFLHLERSFMHLGFHIYDLGFQSPDSEAARPLVWTTTLLLILIIMLLNLTAISIRARLRARFVTGHF